MGRQTAAYTIGRCLYLSSSRRPKQNLLVLGSVNLQQIPLISALVEACAPLGVADELKLGLLQLEGVHIEPLVDGSGVEQKLVGWNGKQGLGELGHTGEEKVLQVLAGQHHTGIPLSRPFQDIADVLNDHPVGEPYMKLIQGGHRVALGQQPVAEIGQHIEQHGVLHISAGLEKPLNTKHQKAVAGDIGVTVEEPAFRTPAHGVKPQKNLLEHFLGVEGPFLAVIVLIRRLNGSVEVGKDGVVLRGKG